MTPLGESLVFYLKYPAEMFRLYEKPEYLGEQPDLEGLADAERVRAMARAVGEAAYREAADFLQDYADKIEDHFNRLGIVNLVTRARPSTILRDWNWYVTVKSTSAREGWFQCGLYIQDQDGTLIPWLWRRGGRVWEEAVKERLGARVHSLSGGGVLSNSGSVALAHIPIFATSEKTDDVDRDVLIAKAVGAFTALQAADVEAISRSVGEENDSPESDAGERDA